MPWVPHEDNSLESLRTSIVMVSDSLFAGTSDFTEDASSHIALELLNDAGVFSINIDYFPDDFVSLRSKVQDDVKTYDLILLLGGSGIGSRDVSVEAIRSVLDKELPGFGEEFRRQSMQEIGVRGLMSRSLAGVLHKSMVVVLPGSPNAVQLGIELIIPMVGHVLNLLHKEH